MIDVDIIILDLNGGDLAIHFVTPDFYEMFKWTPEEVKAFDTAINSTAQWAVALKRRQRIDKISFEDDPRILKTVYTQTWTDGEDINSVYNVGRVMNLEG